MAVTDIKILLVDNYDSFTYNIAHIIRNIPGSNLHIIEAGKINLSDIAQFDKIIFSPGPDLPRPGNIMERILNEYSEKKSILGICLGMQAIVLFFGGSLKQLAEVNHGRRKAIRKVSNEGVMLSDCSVNFEAGLYHSWVADPENIPESIEITAMSDASIMGIRHKTLNIEGVQFHPESIMTPDGGRMMQKWIIS